MRRLMELEIVQAAGTEDECVWLETRLSLIREELGQETYDAAVQDVVSEFEGVFVLDEHRVGTRWRR
jgi:hypothetical protein